jgi:hypothetical protein
MAALVRVERELQPVPAARSELAWEPELARVAAGAGKSPEEDWAAAAVAAAVERRR